MGNEPSKSTGNRSSHEAPPMPSLLSPVSEGTSEHRSQGTQWCQGAPEERRGQDWGAASQALSFTSCVTSGKSSTAHVYCSHLRCSLSGLQWSSSRPPATKVLGPPCSLLAWANFPQRYTCKEGKPAWRRRGKDRH